MEAQCHDSVRLAAFKIATESRMMFIQDSFIDLHLATTIPTWPNSRMGLRRLSMSETSLVGEREIKYAQGRPKLMFTNICRSIRENSRSR